jgi:hypothetical protein
MLRMIKINRRKCHAKLFLLQYGSRQPPLSPKLLRRMRTEQSLSTNWFFQKVEALNHRYARANQEDAECTVATPSNSGERD